MIVYADSSVLVRAYLADENGHLQALRLLEDRNLIVVSGSWTRVEVTGALVRAAKSHREVLTDLLRVWDQDTGDDGPITILHADQRQVEERALSIVMAHGLRAMDAWHVALASLTVPELADGDKVGFATRDDAQAEVARQWGFDPL